MSKRVVFVGVHDRSFVNNDYHMLSKHYDVTREVTRESIQKCDVVYCWFASKHSLKPLYYARKFGKRFIVVTGGYDVANYTEPSMGYKYGLCSHCYTRFLPWYILRHADAILAVSKFNMSEVKKVTRNPHVFYVPNSTHILQSHDFVKESIVLTVGFIDNMSFWRKGLDKFIMMAHTNPEYEFYHIGSIKKDLSLFNRIEMDKAPCNMHFMGYVDNLDVWYRKARVYAQLSEYESFGLSVLEGLNHGCVPVVWNGGALPEIIGGYGVVFDYMGDSRRVLGKAMAMGMDGIHGWIQQYDNSARVDKMVEIIG